MNENTSHKQDGSWIITAIGVVIFSFTLRRIFSTPFRRLLRRFVAYWLDKFQLKYNARMCNRKTALFTDGLKQLMKNTPDGCLKVLEIGAGAGANFAYFPSGTEVTCIDPVPQFGEYLKRNADKFPNVRLGEFHVGVAENMSMIEDESVDAVVCTLVLCSASDVDKCIQEIKRVLKPGGAFLFMEHVEAEKGSKMYRIQHLLNGLWSRCTDCHLTRTTHNNIQRAGFSNVHYDLFQADELITPTPIMRFISLVKSHTSGIAIK